MDRPTIVATSDLSKLHSTDQFSQRLRMPGDGRQRVFRPLVFEDDVARVMCIAEDADQPRQVSLFLGVAVAPLDLGFDLDIQCVRRSCAISA